MRAHLLVILSLLTAALSGCATRWQPDRSAGPVKLTEACPQKRAPLVQDFGPAGVRAVYHIVTQDASNDELGTLIGRVEKSGFGLNFMTVNINGLDTVFVRGSSVLRDQTQADTEFRTACNLGTGKVYLTHVRYNPANEDGASTRVR